MSIEQKTEQEFKRLFYDVENTFPELSFGFNRTDSIARVLLLEQNKIIEVELENIEKSIQKTIWTIKELTNQLDS